MRLFSDVSERIADPWLRRAFSLAENGRGRTSPNPVVGCVIVRDGALVGEGFHERAGGPHAEVVALDATGVNARGATVYVTLEPCSHRGRTPPCTDALLSAGVARVVVGMLDPNDTVRGGGAETLRSAGLCVDVATDPSPFEIQNDAWLASLSNGRPFVRVKVALSLDGRPALRAGQRASITGVSGADVTRLLRQRADAVLVGGATIVADDPALTARDPAGVPDERQPLRVVLVREHIPPGTARVFADGAARTVVLAPDTRAGNVRETLPPAVETIEYEAGDGIAGALRRLLRLGVVDVLVEAGPRLLTALWESALIDELIVVQAGGMAGRDAPALFAGSPDAERAASAALAHVLRPLESGIVGDVAVTVWRPGTTSSNDSRNTRAADLVASSDTQPTQPSRR